MTYEKSLQILSRVQKKYIRSIKPDTMTLDIKICSCGEKYLKTRSEQDKCHWCMGYVDERTRGRTL
jgi:phosphate starvation-inducible protein PhoH